MVRTRQLWQMDRKSCSFQSLCKHIFSSFEGRWIAFSPPLLLPKTMAEVARPPSRHKTGRPERAPYSSPPDMGHEPKPRRAEWTETNNGAFLWNSEPCNIKSKLSRFKVSIWRVMPVPSCELKREAWSEFTCVCVCNVEGRQMKWHHTSCWDDDNVTCHYTYFRVY